jgi:hypothetical protein
MEKLRKIKILALKLMTAKLLRNLKIAKTTNPIPAYIGIAGAIGMAISDVILLSVPGAGSESDMSSFSSLVHVSLLRMAIGPLVGLVCSFFICFGFWYIRQKLAHLNDKLSMLMFISLASVMFFGGAFHAGYYFAGHALYVGDMVLYNAFISQLEIMSYLSIPGLLLGTGIYVYLTGFVPNGFPKWLKFANLIVIQGLVLGVFMILPAPIGGYIKPTFVNVASLLFFVINLKVKES